MDSPHTVALSFCVINTYKGKQKVFEESIRYVKSKGKRSEIFLEENQKIIALHLLKYFDKRLNAKTFARCHRQYIVNLNKITCISGKGVFLDKVEVVPLGRNFRGSIFEKYFHE